MTEFSILEPTFPFIGAISNIMLYSLLFECMSKHIYFSYLWTIQHILLFILVLL